MLSSTPTSPRASKGRLLFVAVNLQPPGGGQCVGAWALQALQRDWDVTILCAETPGFAALNRHFGTSLNEQDFSLIQASWALRNIHRLDPDPYSFQRAAWLMRKARKLGAGFDVIVSCDNEMDFGCPSVQYVHFPYLSRHREAVSSIREMTPLRRFGALLQGRYRPWMMISGVDFDRMQDNRMLVNSHWTAELVRDGYRNQPQVLYPPVMWPPNTLPWDERDNCFVSLGRIEPVKRQLEAISILQQVRQQGHQVRLEIIGDISDAQYSQQVHDLARQAGDWVRIRHTIPRSELEAVVNRARYGLHTMHDEHFGIAVAEMVRAGCLVFVPDGGGQVEIVGSEPALLYRTDEQAVEQICKVLASTAEQHRLQDLLAAKREAFTEQQFMSGLLAEVDAFVQARRA